MMGLLFAALLALSGFPEGAGDIPHKLHVSYGNTVVEGNVIVSRIRLFRDDVEAALRRHGAGAEFTMAADLRTDSLFSAYFAERLTVEVEGERLEGRIIGSGEDSLDREPVWWYAIQFEAQVPVRSFRVRNTLLFDLFDDQRNIFKIVLFPEETQRTYSFAIGEEEFDVRF
jgi:hypothetical protein